MDDEHKKRVQEKIDVYIEKAKSCKFEPKKYINPKKTIRKDSLSQVIKTKEQADEFMLQLKKLTDKG